MSRVNTPQFRVAFPNVFRPRKNELSGKDEYSLVALFPKGTDLSKLKQMAKDACVKKWGPDPKKWPQNLRSPFRDQADRAKVGDDGKEVMPQGYEKGLIYLTLRSTQKPHVVNESVQEILDESEFYGGCWAIASVSAYAYDTKGNRGVSFGLGNVQKIRDDDAFGNRTTPEEDFAPVAVPEGGAQGVKTASDLFS